MKKLVVCGDSFGFSRYDTDWPNIVAKKLGYELKNLSIVGCSNIAICYQIDYALKNINPDLIIITLTGADGFEIDYDDKKVPASLEDFQYNIDEVDTSIFKKDPSIASGNVVSQLRNSHIDHIKSMILKHSFRLSAEKDSWCLQHHFNNIKCKFLVYRNIYPQYHEERKNYDSEFYFGLDKYLIQSGPYMYENEKANNTNHLSQKDNNLFSKRVISDFNNL